MASMLPVSAGTAMVKPSSAVVLPGRSTSIRVVASAAAACTVAVAAASWANRVGCASVTVLATVSTASTRANSAPLPGPELLSASQVPGGVAATAARLTTVAPAATAPVKFTEAPAVIVSTDTSPPVGCSMVTG